MSSPSLWWCRARRLTCSHLPQARSARSEELDWWTNFLCPRQSIFDFDLCSGIPPVLYFLRTLRILRTFSTISLRRPTSRLQMPLSCPYQPSSWFGQSCAWCRAHYLSHWSVWTLGEHFFQQSFAVEITANLDPPRLASFFRELESYLVSMA